MLYENRQGTVRGTFNNFFITEFENDTGTIEHLDAPRFKCRYSYDPEQVDISKFNYDFIDDDDGEPFVSLFEFSDPGVMLSMEKEALRGLMNRVLSALDNFCEELEEGKVMISLDKSQDDENLEKQTN